MTPADIAVVSPTADEILRAVCAAAKLEGEDPLDAVQGLGAVRSRSFAFVALAHQFPTAPRPELAKRLGNANAAGGIRKALTARAWSWFTVDRLNAVRAACGWPPMTLADAEVAPLVYCGRSWVDFLPAAPSPPMSQNPASNDEGKRDKPAPAPVEPKLDAPALLPQPTAVNFPLARAEAAAPPPAKPAPRASDAVPREDAPPPPKPPSPTAAALASAARTITATKSAPTPSRRASAPGSDGFASFRAAELGRGVTTFRPDAPAHVRGVTVVALPGDPQPGQSALDQRRAAEAARRN